MKSRGLDKNNDLVIRKGSFFVVDEGAEVAQHVRTRLLFYLSEWFLNTNAGTPYFEEIFNKPANLATIESILKSRILNTPGVSLLIEFNMEYEGPETRQLNISFTAQTVYGIIENEEVTINV